MSFMAHFDADEFDALQALFAPDGTWVRSDGTLRGMAEATMCIPYMRARTESLHTVVMDVTPNAILVVDGDLVTARTGNHAHLLAGTLIGMIAQAGRAAEPAARSRA
jgi:hypothetical protein